MTKREMYNLIEDSTIPWDHEVEFQDGVLVDLTPPKFVEFDLPEKPQDEQLDFGLKEPVDAL